MCDADMRIVLKIMIMIHDDPNDDDDDSVDRSVCGQPRGEYVENLGINTCLPITFTFFNFASNFHLLLAFPSLSLSLTLPLAFTFFQPAHHFHFL